MNREEEFSIIYDFLIWEHEVFGQEFNDVDCTLWVNEYLNTKKRKG